jgi:hypothetical protein
MPTNDSGVAGVHEGGKPMNRDDITVGHVDEPVKVYRTDGFPPIFAGFRVDWVSGDDPATGVTFQSAAGAGCGSPYLTLAVEVPGHPMVYEYVDVRELVEARVRAIVDELTAKPGILDAG